MRRLISIAAFALLLSVPVWAQRGGGHGGGSHGGGFSGHAGFGGGHVSGGHFSGGMRGGFSHGSNRPSFNRPSRSGFSRSPYLHNGFHNGFRRDGFRDRDRFRHRGSRFVLRNNCYGWGCRGGWGYPWWGWGYDPWLWDWWDNDSSYNDDYYQNLAIANQMNEQSLEQQRMLHEEETDGDQDVYARPSHSAAEPNPSSASSGEPMLPATVLIFRDQHQQEIRNYAIVGQTLWNFAPQHTQKIPLSELDLGATEKANDDRGVTFRVPSSGEAQ
ncbi:MAG TPA: hypothetical protein VKQ11_22120 [Candidatus Sulfotelmatobacter sp.]|nr:hypothetical protein [Candidatus Sulfotelmatobacter sp.]